MRVALTYDLRDEYIARGYSEEEAAEFDRVDTIEALHAAVAAWGHDVVRVGSVYQLVPCLAAGERFDLVFNIAEGARGFGRESQIPALLDAYEIPYVFSDPLVCALTLHKAMAKRVLRDAGVPTPDFALVERPGDAARVDLPFPLFAKPVAEGTSKGIAPDSKIATKERLIAVCTRLLQQFQQPVLVERFLPGREVTVGVVGTGEKARAAATLDVELLAGADAEIYTFRNKEDCERLVRYRLLEGSAAEDAEAIALAAWRVIGCRDGGRVDLRQDERGRWSVMELNPLPGMHPEHSDLPILWGLAGRSYRDLVGEILASALERVPAAARERRPGAERGSESCAS